MSDWKDQPRRLGLTAAIIKRLLEKGKTVYIDLDTKFRVHGRIVSIEVGNFDSVRIFWRNVYGESEGALVDGRTYKNVFLDNSCVLKKNEQGVLVLRERDKKVVEEAQQKPTIVAMCERLLAKGTPVFLTLGKLRYFLQSVEWSPDNFLGPRWIMHFNQKVPSLTTTRAFTPDGDNDGWKLRKSEEGGYEMYKAQELEEDHGVESVLTLPGKVAYNLIQKHLGDNKLYLHAPRLGHSFGGVSGMVVSMDVKAGGVKVACDAGEGWTSVGFISWDELNDLRVRKKEDGTIYLHSPELPADDYEGEDETD